ncbi:hypothetical protein AAG570_010228 [Ranatra chinensis]|uniref:BTB domain-containing protein n=1 Tax=Ranatra chinensis TaxID=642074 RepID=A0ABD0YLY3_9HEMI
MNDICLVVGGVEYPAHRLILCASSEVFQVMLMNPQWSESHESRIVLQETPACAAIFGEFLRYFYTGQIRINHLIITPLLTLADKYNVKDLTNLCVEYMCAHIAHASTNNQLITWFQYALSLGHHKVAAACQSFLKWNFEMVAERSDFGNCNPDILSKLLQQNDLVVNNEMTLYKDVQHQNMIEDGMSEAQVEVYMESLVQEVMSHVRFPMMSPRQLAELLLSPLTTKYKEFFIERMAIGMSFHSDQKERLSEIAKDDNGRLLFTPRLYTADRWSSLLSVENFTALDHYDTRALVFSSHLGLAEHTGDKTCEWVIDLYPKGVWFRKFLLIAWEGTVKVPERVLSTVRLSVTCRDAPPSRVRVGLLVIAVEDGVEHVANVVQRVHRFTEKDPLLNIDDVLPFEELNTSLINNQGNGDAPPKVSKYLVGPGRDILKIYIVIAPLEDISCVDVFANTFMLPSQR